MRNALSPPPRLVVEDGVLPATAFAYLHCDVPANMTLDEWRRTRNRARRAARLDARRGRRAARGANLRHWTGRR
jgi:hypothetical protein